MIRLHHCHQTRSMRTLWLLNELELKFELTIHPFDKSLRHPDYLRLNPAGRIPALEIDGTTLFETGAIAEYLCETRPEAGLGRQPGHPERGEWLIWLHFAETISQHIAALTQQHIALYPAHVRSPVVMKLERKRLEKTLAAVDARLAGRNYLLDSGFSAIDIGCGQAANMAQHFTHLTEFPHLSDWHARLTGRPAFAASLPPPGADRLYNKPFYEVPDG